LLTAGIAFSASAQSITGTIIDVASNTPLPGVTVLQKGTTNGTVTDTNGKFSLSLQTAGNKTIIISSIGYKSQEIEVGSQTNFSINLAEDIALLADIVVVGYGEQEKKDVTGAINTIKAEDFNAGVISSPEQLIQGRSAGVQIASSSGEPGAGVNIRIRGTSSVRSNNNPLFVIDGVPLAGDATSSGGQGTSLGSSSARNPLNFLNPNDIASIDILKDASATAIYGSRGANGVVIITTKRGEGGKGTLSYSYAVSAATISKKYDVLNASEFLDAYTDIRGATAAANLDGGADTNWQDQIFRTGITQSHNLSYGAGDKTSNYLFSIGYMDQEGIVKESGLKRFTARFNGSKKFMDDRLTISTQLSIAETQDDNIPITDNAGFEGDLLANAIKLNPTQPVRNPDGTLNQISNTEINPVAFLEYSKDYTNTLRALGNISVEYKIIDELSFKTVVGLDRSFSSRKAAYSSLLRTEFTTPFLDPNTGDVLRNGGRAFFNENQVNNQLWENYFSYKKTFGQVDVSALLGYSYQSFQTSSSGLELANFRTTDLDQMINNYSSVDLAQANSVAPTNSSNIKDELQSFYTRVNIGISDKYLFTATVRMDGSTRFGANNKYGIFPAFAFKWRVIDEAFVPDFFSDLNLRIGYGVTGNQEIPYNVYSTRQRYDNADINNSGAELINGSLTDISYENEDIQWESTSQFNLGIDYGFWNNRVTGSIDYYFKTTNKLMILFQTTQPAATDFFWDNLDADVINTGVEFSINVVAVDTDDFEWTVGGNVAYNKNEVRNDVGLLKINTGAIDGQGLTGSFSQRIENGRSLFSFYMPEFAGFDDNGQSIYPNGQDPVFVNATPLPSVVAGLSNDFKYKNFDMNIFFTGQFGQYVYSNTDNAFFTAGSLGSGRNVTRNVVGNGESDSNPPTVSTRFLQKADFVRLQNVTIGYNLNVESKLFSSFRFYINGQNLFVLTPYDGQDPEVSTNKAINGVPSAGIDYTPYPRARTFTFGVNARF
jgi:iron complex outermembrane receptor protein